MNYQQAVDRLIEHGWGYEASESALLSRYWYCIRRLDKDRVTPDYRALYQDLLECLEAVNRHLNGLVPSESTIHVERYDAQLVRSISVILDDGWQLVVMRALNSSLDQSIATLSVFLWAIALAWRYVLDGDIDDLAKEVVREARAKDIPIQSFMVSAKCQSEMRGDELRGG